jgi:hypothetical protein
MHLDAADRDLPLFARQSSDRVTYPRQEFLQTKLVRRFCQGKLNNKRTSKNKQKRILAGSTSREAEPKVERPFPDGEHRVPCLLFLHSPASSRRYLTPGLAGGGWNGGERAGWYLLGTNMGRDAGRCRLVKSALGRRLAVGRGTSALTAQGSEAPAFFRDADNAAPSWFPGSEEYVLESSPFSG